MIKYIVANVLLCALWYLIGSFVQADFNFTHWTWEARVFTVMCWICTLVPFNAVVIEIRASEKARLNAL